MLVLVDEVAATSTDELEVKNLDEAYELIQQIVSDPSVRIDEGLVRTMNSIILKGLPTAEARDRGKYRVGTSLIVNAQTRSVRYRPPPPEWVPVLMANFVKEVQRWISETIYPGPVIAALAHFGLISIHPFIDGNGRTARLLADMILQKTGWSNAGMLSVSEAIFRRQQDYYDALYATQGEDFKGSLDATKFVTYHCEVLMQASTTLEDIVVRFNRNQQDFISQARGLFNARQALAFMFMLDVAPLSTSACAELTGSSQSVALGDLSELVKRGILVRTGQGRNTRYGISPRTRKEVEEVDFELEKRGEYLRSDTRRS
ncbi:MAG: Fic family protein [Chloroflexota bacterium]